MDRPPLKPWILPLMLVSIGVIVVGIISTYADLTIGAVIVFVGLCGVFVAGWAAGGSDDSDNDSRS